MPAVPPPCGHWPDFVQRGVTCALHAFLARERVLLYTNAEVTDQERARGEVQNLAIAAKTLCALSDISLCPDVGALLRQVSRQAGFPLPLTPGAILTSLQADTDHHPWQPLGPHNIPTVHEVDALPSTGFASLRSAVPLAPLSHQQKQ